MTTLEAQEAGIYIPRDSIFLDSPDFIAQLRLGIQGEGGTGKSYAGMSFPYPTVLSYDRGLIMHKGRKDIQEIKFYDDSVVDKIESRLSSRYTDIVTNIEKLTPANRKDALIKWLETEGQKLTSKQTFIIDGGTGVEAAFTSQYWVSPKMTKEGELDKWGEWNQKIKYFDQLFVNLKGLRCNVIFIFHEVADRAKDGELNGKVRPLLTGQSQDKLLKEFTDWYRSRVIPKPDDKDGEKRLKEKFRIDDQTFSEWMTSTPESNRSIYLWQTQSDDIVNCKTSLVGAPKFVLAHASVFTKYDRTTEIE